MPGTGAGTVVPVSSRIIKGRRAFLLQSRVKFYTDSGKKVWEGCGKVGKGLEGAKSHDRVLRKRHFSRPPSSGVSPL